MKPEALETLAVRAARAGYWAAARQAHEELDAAVRGDPRDRDAWDALLRVGRVLRTVRGGEGEE